MSTHLHLNDDDLVLHYYGEMPAAEDARAESHLGACGECQSSYARLQRVMALVDSAPAAEAPDGFERTAWARLEPALQRPGRGWFAWVPFSPAPFALAAGVLVLVGAAFMAGRLAPRSGPAGGAAPRAASADSVRERILLVDLGEHLDRSQMMLVELVGADDSSGSADISFERSRAEQLVAANRLYRRTAASTGDAAMVSLLDDLERVLVDVAASPQTLSQEDLDSMRRRIESKELLFKVQIVSSQVRAREKADIQARTTGRTIGS